MGRTVQGLATIEAAGKHFRGGLTLPRLFRPRAPHVLHPLPLLPNILKRLQLLVLKRNTSQLSRVKVPSLMTITASFSVSRNDGHIDVREYVHFVRTVE